MLLANCYALVGRSEDAERAATLAMTLRPNDALVLYNVACLFGQLGKKAEALDAIKKAWDAGYKERVWARRDPDLAILHGDPEFEKLFPPEPGEA
jgi:non-specific serine/threonine protein kinase